MGNITLSKNPASPRRDQIFDSTLNDESTSKRLQAYAPSRFPQRRRMNQLYDFREASRRESQRVAAGSQKKSCSQNLIRSPSLSIPPLDGSLMRFADAAAPPSATRCAPYCASPTTVAKRGASTESLSPPICSDGVPTRTPVPNTSLASSALPCIAAAPPVSTTPAASLPANPADDTSRCTRSKISSMRW